MAIFDHTLEPREFDPPRALLAAVDAIEPRDAAVDDPWSFRFDGIDERHWQMAGGKRAQVILQDRNFPTYVVEASANQIRELVRPVFDKLTARDEGPESRWWRLRLGPSGRTPQVRLYNSLFQDGLALRLESLDLVDSADSSELNHIASMSLDDFPDALESEIKAALRPSSSAVAVGVLDVGQGAANAILDADDMPVAYFDLGGGVTNNHRTWPNDLRNLCFTKKPTVVLSHWDMDHWAGHRRCHAFLNDDDSVYQDQVWIIPRQHLKLSHRKFLKRLRDARAHILVWPDSLPRVDCGVITLGKMNGSDPNNSGIVMLLRQPDGRDGVFLPGDAAPEIFDRRLPCTPHTLVAPHHGAFTDQTHQSGSLRTFVLSFGQRNTYGHPDFRTVAGYKQNDWQATVLRKKMRHGKFGHIHISLSGSPTSSGLSHHGPGCGGSLCQLEYAHFI